MRLLLAWLCIAVVAGGEAKPVPKPVPKEDAKPEEPVGPQPSRSLELQIDSPRPLTIPGWITLRVVNVTERPIGLGLDHDSFRTGIVTLHAPATGDGPWAGPLAGAPIPIDEGRCAVEGWHAGATASVKEAWNARPPLLLTAGEGYARRVQLQEGFLSEVALGKNKNAVLQAIAVVWEHPPVGLPPTPHPGDTIKLGDGADVAVGRTIALALKKGRAPEPTAEPGDPVTLELQPVSAKAGEDASVAYLVRANKPVWLWQNALWPAAATVTLAADKSAKKATLDNKALVERVAWLPKRAPRRLEPGEALVFVRTIPAATIAATKLRKLRVTVELPVATAESEPAADAAAPAGTAMTAACDLVVE